MITRRTARIPFGERYRTSRTIFGQAMRLLGRERDLGVFPLLSALLLAVSIGGFGVLAFAYGDAWMESLGVAPPFGLLVLTLLLLPLFYPFAVAGSLFNTAMVFAIHERLAGRRATKRAALQRAWSQLGPLARFNLVGMLVAGILQVVGVLLNKLRLVPYLGQAVQALGFLG
ncbi:MAG TPA: hypothetical protein VI796_06765, partial [Candidatus Thermoplasmatota archaeon]|nr:hypothetical protein [Candidatus Thermoplasmatota archaeon]